MFALVNPHGGGLELLAVGEDGGKEHGDAGRASLQGALKGTQRDDSRYGYCQTKDGGVEGFGDTHGDSRLCFGGTEDAEDIHQAPRGTKDAEHGGNVGDDADGGQPAALGVDVETQSRFDLLLQVAVTLVFVLSDEEHFVHQWGVVAAAVLAQFLFVPRVAEVLNLLGTVARHQVKQNGGEHQDGADEQRITEGVAGLKELNDLMVHDSGMG